MEKYPNSPAGVGLLFLGLGVWLTSDRHSFWAAVLGYPAFSLGFGGLVMSATTSSSALNRIRVPGAAMMSTLAYTFYLTHKELIHFFHSWLKPYSFFQDGNVMGPALFLICIVGATILHLVVEKPCLRLRDYLLSSLKRGELLPDTIAPAIMPVRSD